MDLIVFIASEVLSFIIFLFIYVFNLFEFREIRATGVGMNKLLRLSGTAP